MQIGSKLARRLIANPVRGKVQREKDKQEKLGSGVEPIWSQFALDPSFSCLSFSR
jgi:hypothetical protein